MIIAPFFLLATIFLRPFLHYPEMDKWGRGPWAACPVCSLAVVTVTGGRGLKRDLFFEFHFFFYPGILNTDLKKKNATDKKVFQIIFQMQTWRRCC